MTQPLEILEQMKAALDDAYAAGVRNSQRTWVGLTPQDYKEIFETARTGEHAVQLAESKLKEKNT